MYHNDYIDAVTEYLRRYREFSQYIANVKTDIEECQRMLEQEAAPATSSMSPTGGCCGGEKMSQHRHYIMRKAWQRSCRNHAVKSRCRHAKMLARKGYRYKGGR